MTSAAVPAPGRPARSGTGPSGPARALALAFWVVLPALSLLGVVLGLVTVAERVTDKPAGIPGTYTVQTPNCSGGICLPIGTFTSQDGSFVRDLVVGDYRWSSGTHRAVYDLSSSSNTVVPLPGRWDPTGEVTAIAGGVGLLLLWGWSWRGARREEHGTAPVPLPA